MKLYIRYIFLFIFLTVTFCTASGQNYIGLNSGEIAQQLRAANPQFKLDKNAVNHTYKYLKYVDKISDQTILFFMSDQDECTYVRWMSDYSNLNDMIGMLNAKYAKNGANSWAFTSKGEDYSITLVEEEWYFTVNFRKN